ncbi:MAG: N-acetylmuramoyl-L-alanine amidase [Spirochaetota bacterium]
MFNTIRTRRVIIFFAAIAIVFQCAPSSSAKRLFRVFIDPGHTRHTNSVRGIIGEEYLVNYAVSRHLEELLRADGRFEVGISRGASNYLGIIPETVASNQVLLYGIARTTVTNDRRNAQMEDKDLAELYAVRYYAIQKKCDLLLSIHFDYVADKRHQREEIKNGFHLCVSPNNRRFDESMTAARTIRAALAARYRSNPTIEHNKQFITPDIRKHYDLKTLVRDGIALRSLIILGDAFENAYYERAKITPEVDVPSVLVECGFLHEKRFLEDKELRELANCLYRGLIAYAGLPAGAKP